MKRYIFNQKDNNHIKVLFLNKEHEVYSLDEGEQLNKCEEVWNTITTKDLRTPFFKTHKKAGFILAVIEDPINNSAYLVETLKTEYEGHEQIIVMVNDKTDDNIQDFISIAKMLDKNLVKMGGDYKQQIIDGKIEYKKFLKNYKPNSVLANPIRDEEVK